MVARSAFQFKLTRSSLIGSRATAGFLNRLRRERPKRRELFRGNPFIGQLGLWLCHRLAPGLCLTEGARELLVGVPGDHEPHRVRSRLLVRWHGGSSENRWSLQAFDGSAPPKSPQLQFRRFSPPIIFYSFACLSIIECKRANLDGVYALHNHLCLTPFRLFSLVGQSLYSSLVVLVFCFIFAYLSQRNPPRRAQKIKMHTHFVGFP